MKITKLERNKLWGEFGPYSEVHLIIETRILDDSVSRIFAIVEVNINPFTYEIIKKHRKQFQDDVMIQQIIDHSEYRGLKFGYVVCAYQQEYADSTILIEAQEHVEYAKKVIIKMHKFVMERIDF